jgi:hypothetical protein
MARVLERIRNRITENPKWTLITVVSLGLYLVSTQLVAGTICVMNAVAGLPCPACGITRALLALVRLDLESALRWHPLFWLILLSGAVMLVKAKLPAKVFKGFMWATLILLFGVYVTRMVLHFPNTEPLTLNRASFLWRIIALFT